MKNIRRRCKICKQWIYNPMPSQIVCSYDCSMEYVKIKENRDKYINKIKREFKQNDKSKLREKAVSVFNKYIRERDKNLPCISCGHTHGRQFHAGHFKPAGANPQLRFNELNVHKQCSICNNYKSGNLANYRINLIKKIGLQNVEALESDKTVKKYSEQDYKDIIVTYTEKIKNIEM